MLLEFLGLSRRSLENPRVSLGDVEAWNELFGTSDTDSGVPMSHAKALRYSPVWQAVSLLSGDVAKLPLEVFMRTGPEAREAAKSHPAYRLVRRKSNREMAAFRFWRRLMVHALLWGNAYAFIDRNGLGEPLELLPLLPDRTTPHRRDGKLWYITEVAGRLKPIPAYDVLHIEGLAHEGLAGCDLVDQARNDFSLGLAAIKFQSLFFKHGVRTGGILELPVAMNKPARDKLEEGFKKHHEGSDNWFKTIVLRDGAKFHQTSIPPGEAQMIETRREQRRDVASWFNLPPHKLGDDSKVSHNSLESENQSYLDGTLSHWLNSIEGECWMKLLTPAQQLSDSHYFEHNVNALVRADVATRYRNYNLGINAGILSPDECRARENLPPRPDGKGGEYRQPLNMTTSGAKPADPKAAPDDKTEAKDPTADDADQARAAAHRRILLDVVGRMARRLAVHARKAAKSEATYRAWLAGELLGHRNVVQAAFEPVTAAIALDQRADETKLLARFVDQFFAAVQERLSVEPADVEERCRQLDAAEAAIVETLLA